MCTYDTTKLTVTGSGKGATGWFTLRDAQIYFDHPVHAPYDHSLNIDLLNAELGPSARVALELDPHSARDLAESILAALDRAPAGLFPASTGTAAAR
ncbi:MAG TPA: DUF6295 family protein [Acidimicrobiales bacterium]|nr:DUF6295 family protein [Acidimicrobiales bacterium]